MTSPLRTAPWTRALGLIWRHPAVVGGVLGGCAVLGAAAAAPALFVSSAANAAQATQVDARCAATIGATIDQAAVTEGFDRAVREATASEPAIGSPIVTFSSSATAVTADGEVPTGVSFISRSGALDHERERGAGHLEGLVRLVIGDEPCLDAVGKLLVESREAGAVGSLREVDRELPDPAKPRTVGPPPGGQREAAEGLPTDEHRRRGRILEVAAGHQEARL